MSHKGLYSFSPAIQGSSAGNIDRSRYVVSWYGERHTRSELGIDVKLDALWRLGFRLWSAHASYPADPSRCAMKFWKKRHDILEAHARISYKSEGLVS